MIVKTYLRKGTDAQLRRAERNGTLFGEVVCAALLIFTLWLLSVTTK